MKISQSLLALVVLAVSGCALKAEQASQMGNFSLCKEYFHSSPRSKTAVVAAQELKKRNYDCKSDFELFAAQSGQSSESANNALSTFSTLLLIEATKPQPTPQTIIIQQPRPLPPVNIPAARQ